MKSVSIVVPAYNAQKYIRECIDSILVQTYRNIELIFVNDGSTDNSLEVVSEIEDNRLIIVNQENRGVSAARNTGISVAEGDYLCFVDADDLLEADFICNMVHEIESNNCDIVFGNFKFLYEDGNIIEKTCRLKEGLYSCEDLASKCIDDGTLTGILFGSVCGVIYKTGLIKENNISFRNNIKVNEDGIFNIEVMKSANKIVVSSASGYLYRQWKTVKKETLSFETDELDKATNVLSKLSSTVCNGELQMARRLMTVHFWSTLRVENADMGCFNLSRRLREHCSSNRVLDDNYGFLDFEHLNIYKRILIKLLKYRMYFIYVFVLKHIAPLVKKRVGH